MRLIINKIKYRLNNEKTTLYYSFKQDLGIKRNISLLLKKFDGKQPSLKSVELKATLENNSNKYEEVYFSFNSNQKSHPIGIDLNDDSYFRELFVVHLLKNYFKRKYIAGKSLGRDLSIFIPTEQSEVEGWNKYKVLSFLVSRATISVGVTSRATYISEVNVIEQGISKEILTRVLFEEEVVHIDDLKTFKITKQSLENLKSDNLSKDVIIKLEGMKDTVFKGKHKFLDILKKAIGGEQVERYKSFILKHTENLDNLDNTRIVANRDIKMEAGLPRDPEKFSYKSYYQEIRSFYENELLQIKDGIIIYEGGFEEVFSENINHVDTGRSVMLFNNGARNVNVSNGMKHHGPFQTLGEEKLNNLSMIFIYKDSEDANTLYKYLKNGLRHFPGLESYVGIPVKPNKELSLKYSSVEKIEAEFDVYLRTKLSESNYPQLFAFYISPFKKDEVEGKQSEIYYKIKEGLLKKGISSQVIASRTIHSNNFHFSLPNIAVATLAKLGGVPWKLARNEYEELIIGFGRRILTDGSFIGNTVFFDNSGLIKQISSLTPPQNNDLGSVVKKSIIEFLLQQVSKPKRVVIHYYKPPKWKEVETVEKALRNLGLDIPYVIIEIHDNKAKDFICFDADYQMGMPKSGTVIRLRKRDNTYLLFNNSRYEDRPAGYVIDEYPIKVRIHHAQGVYLDEKTQIQLIDQVYEFSRIYWKSIRQQSHPVTVKYAKLIADFASKFENHVIPENEVSQTTAWFI